MKSYITIKAIRLFISLLLLGNAAFSQQVITNSSAKAAIGCAPTDLNILVTQGSDALGCYYDVEYRPIWALIAGSLCNINQAPYGFYVEFSGATISGNPFRTGAWLLSAIQTIGTNFVYWNKQPMGVCPLPTNSIPTNQLQKARIRVTPGSGNVTVTVRELTGGSWPNVWAPPIPSNASGWQSPGNLPYSGVWDCGMVSTFSPPPIAYNIGPNTPVCSGTFMVLNLSPVPPAGSTVTWYRSNTPCPTGNPPGAGWTVAQTGGNSYNTNAMTNSACFVAVITTGCYSYISIVKTVTVCPGAPSATITATQVGIYLPLQLINNQYRACIQWQGMLTLSPITFPCPTTIIWEKKYTGTTVWTPIASSLNQTQINTQPLFLLSSIGCYTGYDFRAKLVNACGTTYVPFTIFIDNLANGGAIKTQSSNFYDVGSGTNIAPILCYEMGTRLVHTTTCGKIKWWEYRDEITPCSNNFPPTWTNASGSNGTSTWFTGNLIKTRQYRVLVENGGCNNDLPLPNQGIYSNVFTVTVKPELIVNISTTSNLLCMNPILTATTSYGPCNYAIASFKWYFNGTLIPAATVSTYQPTKPGNYSVVVSDGQCKSTAKSNVITICAAKLVVTGPCCICPNETVAVSAVVTYSPNNCGPTPTYLWSNGATTSSIQVTQQGNYSVTVTWGTCILTGTAYIGPCQ